MSQGYHKCLENVIMPSGGDDISAGGMLALNIQISLW